MSGTACKVLLCWPHLANGANEVVRVIEKQYSATPAPFAFDNDTLEELIAIGLQAEALVARAYKLLVHEAGEYGP